MWEVLQAPAYATGVIVAVAMILLSMREICSGDYKQWGYDDYSPLTDAEKVHASGQEPRDAPDNEGSEEYRQAS